MLVDLLRPMTRHAPAASAQNRRPPWACCCVHPTPSITPCLTTSITTQLPKQPPHLKRGGTCMTACVAYTVHTCCVRCRDNTGSPAAGCTHSHVRHARPCGSCMRRSQHMCCLYTESVESDMRCLAVKPTKARDRDTRTHREGWGEAVTPDGENIDCHVRS